jgi:hypothetical protein
VAYPLTVVSLSNAVLNSSALGQVGDLGPVLIRIRRAAEGTASAVGGHMS